MHRDIRAFRDDPGRDEIGRVETTSALVHLRRPSKLSTQTPEDTQPFCDPRGRFVFGHNGDFRETRRQRAIYRREGRIHGRADTEVGQRWLEDEWRDGAQVGDRLERLHRAFGGSANLALLTPDGTPTIYAGNAENLVFAFGLGRIGLASTAIYSIDRSLFRLVAPGANRRRLVRPGTTMTLMPDGNPLPAS